MKGYTYDQHGRFLGAEPIELGFDGRPLIPHSATLDAPPSSVPDGHVAVFRDSAWEVCPDNLGKDYWLADGTPGKIQSYSEELPEGASFEPPPAPPAPPRRIGTPREFLGLFTEAEKLAFFQIAQGSPELHLWWAEASTGDFSLDHPSVAIGLEALVQAGVLSNARRDEITDAEFGSIDGGGAP